MLPVRLAATILIAAIALAFVFYVGRTEDGSIVSLIQCETNIDNGRRYERQCERLGPGLVAVFIPVYLALSFVWTALWGRIRQANSL